jgi:hypothetical protein
MKLDKLLFWILIVLLCVYVLFNLNLTNNTLENFTAGIDDYVDTGYGNVQMKPKDHAWRKSPSNEPLLKDTTTLLGHDMPLSDFKDAPLEDGQQQMFMFAKNKCSADCCPSTYTCSGGCVCTTEQQRNLINKRG